MVLRDSLSEIEAEPAYVEEQPRRGRSLWDDAWARLKANRAAVTSAVLLVSMALACLIGPALSPHDFDAVYSNYVKVPASLKAYPREAEIEPVLERTLRRARLQLDDWRIEGGRLFATVSSSRQIDERTTRYLDRADLFEDAQIIGKSADGETMTVSVGIERQRFLFGTDSNGRDMLTRTLVAGRISLTIGLLATFVALVIGVTYGAVSGYIGGRTDMVMMRVVDVLYSLPFIFFVILLVVFFGRNFILMFIAVGAVEWLDMARIVRGQTISLKRQEFIQAAEAMGVGNGGILKRHIVPNTLGPVVVYMTLLVPKVILLESFLSFLGLGVQEPMTSWGVLISEGARNIQGASWMLVFPSTFLVATLFSLNFIGDGLRDALDPKDR
ncbi:MAG: ABC transporter permease subunit [Hyphomicrobiales bacterium]|nr:ABC transporter permease subunit [Hyphomicrobiales bacterium]